MFEGIDCSCEVIDGDVLPLRLVKSEGEFVSPLVVTSPHSGRRYLRRFLEQAAIGLADLRRVEDAGLDCLLSFEALPCPVLLAEFPRSFVDVNRGRDEIDAGMFEGLAEGEKNGKMTRYLRSGLGMIPKKALGGMDIYEGRLSAEELALRRTHYYTPFHHQLTTLIEEAKATGDALLIDCHSMPSGIFGVSSDIIIGSHHGASADEAIVDEAVRYFTDAGLKTTLNKPFSGGYITQHYGKPKMGVSALQIEISRPLYLNEAKIELREDWQKMAKVMTGFIKRMDAMMKDYRSKR